MLSNSICLTRRRENIWYEWQPLYLGLRGHLIGVKNDITSCLKTLLPISSYYCDHWLQRYTQPHYGTTFYHRRADRRATCIAFIVLKHCMVDKKDGSIHRFWYHSTFWSPMRRCTRCIEAIVQPRSVLATMNCSTAGACLCYCHSFHGWCFN
jgi:hypothetical protein